jgi:hypothetical protein
VILSSTYQQQQHKEFVLLKIEIKIPKGGITSILQVHAPSLLLLPIVGNLNVRHCCEFHWKRV